MFDIVVCSRSKDLMDRSIKAINKALIEYEFDYHIEVYNGDIINNDRTRKIYLIDVDDYLDVAYKIRRNNFISIIILISKFNNINESLFHKKLLILDYISFNKHYDKNLVRSIVTGYEILIKNKVYTFMYNHVIYCIPYEEINYIEKELNLKRCIIHTIKKVYYVVNSIERINNSLNGMFIKGSQSSIINLENIDYIDCINNIVCFKNGSVTSLITEKTKKIIRDYMNN